MRSRRIEKEGPTGLITATTLARLHPENETRLLSLSLDESDEQTRNVKQAAAAKYQDAGEPVDVTLWVNAQRILQPVKVSIPFATYLADHTPDRPLRIRRDFNKLLSLIEASATLHQYQRDPIADGIIEANLGDYFIAVCLMEQAFFHSLYDMHPNTVAIVEAIKELDGTTIGSIQTRTLMDHLTGWGKSKVLRWAKPLKEYDWVIEGGRGCSDTYQVGIDPRESNQRLPALEHMAEEFPDLANKFQIIHPLTGTLLNLTNEAASA